MLARVYGFVLLARSVLERERERERTVDIEGMGGMETCGHVCHVCQNHVHVFAMA